MKSGNIIKKLKSKVLEKAATKLLKRIEKFDKLRKYNFPKGN